MKKILNNPDEYVDEMLDGIIAAYPDIYQREGDSGRVIKRTEITAGKVGIVTGGGSGHLPLFHGYIGQGLVDACAVGNVFAGPRVNDCLEAMKACHAGAGVLQLYGNYGGDKMNFDMAQEFAILEGMQVTSVRMTDDIASAPVEEKHKRRGVAGMVYAYKLAGAKADTMASLEEVTAVANKAVEACCSIGVALSSCVIPESGKPAFELGEDEIEFGMGIHGEPGIWRSKLRTANELSMEMIDLINQERNFKAGDRVSIMVNSLGATPLEELYIVYKSVKKLLSKKQVQIVMPLIGRYATSMEMSGFSITVCQLDDELEHLLLSPAKSPFWSQS